MNILSKNFPLFGGFIKLLARDYNTPKIRTGYRRVFDDETGDMIGFLIPAKGIFDSFSDSNPNI
jgi:hypothetical protein